MNKGKIYLIPSPVSDTPAKSVIAPVIQQVIETLKLFFVENARTARRFFSAMGIKNISEYNFEILNKYTDQAEIERLLSLVEKGSEAGILSEAGSPGIADPGSNMVRQAHSKNIQVIPLPGPSSVLLALMASGFNGQSFVFHGYLPIDRNKRNQKIRELEKTACRDHQTQIFMETPYRNMQLLKNLKTNLKEDTLLCVAADITGKNEIIRSKPLKEWKLNDLNIHKRPAIFLIYHS